MADELRARAMYLYDHGDIEALKTLASETWPAETSSIPSPGAAEVCRCMFIMAVRTGDSTAAHLWRARAMSAAVLNRSTDTIAGLVLQPFFVLMELESYAEARLVLEELLRLVPEEHPRAQLFRGRLYNEKRAYSFAAEGRFKDALKSYMAAATHCTGDLRGALKVRGGAAIAGYLALHINGHDNMDTAARPFIATMEEVAATARDNAFPDVSATASANVAIMKVGATEGWFPFETV